MPFPPVRGNWADHRVLNAYFSHGTDGQKHYTCAADYMHIGVKTLVGLVLAPPGRPTVKAQAIAAWYKAHGYFPEITAPSAIFEVLLTRAFGVSVQVTLKQPPLGHLEIRMYLTNILLLDGRRLASVADYGQITWSELQRARCFPLEANAEPKPIYLAPGLKPITLEALLMRTEGKTTLRQFQELFKRVFGGEAPLQKSAPQPLPLRCSDDELRAMLATGKFGGKPCNTLEAIFAIGMREFIHRFTFTWNGRQYDGVAFFPHNQTKAAWQHLLIRAYGEEPVAKLWYEDACNDRNFIVKRPDILREYLENGYMPSGDGHKQLSTPQDYLKVGLRNLIHGKAYCQPSGRRRYRVFNLIEAAGGGRSQTRQALLNMLISAFGVTEVMAAMEDLPAFEEFHRRWSQVSPTATV